MLISPSDSGVFIFLYMKTFQSLKINLTSEVFGLFNPW